MCFTKKGPSLMLQSFCHNIRFLKPLKENESAKLPSFKTPKLEAPSVLLFERFSLANIATTKKSNVLHPLEI